LLKFIGNVSFNLDRNLSGSIADVTNVLVEMTAFAFACNAGDLLGGSPDEL
jgi:hypothetical protein